jgi:hypothetical protein
MNEARGRLEADPESIVAQYLRIGDPHEAHRIILRQRVDWLGGAAILCAQPVRLEFAAGAGPELWRLRYRAVIR